MEIRPILSTLRRSPTGAILVALQIALALAIVVNSMYIIVQRLELLNRDPGMDVANTFAMIFVPIGKTFNAEVVMREDLDVLRSLPGIKAATAINNLPLSGGGSASRYFTEPAEKGVSGDGNYFEVDEHGLETLGAKLAEGRNFDASVVKYRESASSGFVPEVIVTRPFANELFPGQSALGKEIYDGLGQPARIIGIIDNLHGSWPGWDKFDHVLLHPVIAQPGVYLVRAQPGQRDAMMRIAEDKLSAIENGRIVRRVVSMEQIAGRTYADDRAMAVFLSVLIVLLVAVAALGVFGLAAFNVSTRTKQIGTRRALGARRIDIVRYFLIENWLVTTLGIALGCVLALGLGYWLSASFELPRLKLYYLVTGVLILWVIGVGSALVPARRASLVSPAVATRTV